MRYPEKRKLFTIKEISHACGVSRATLIRMEEDGFFRPNWIDPDTGYRYYDTQNVAAVGQYQRLHTIGLSRKEIADLYLEREDSDKLLEGLRQKLNRLQRFLNDYELRHDKSKNFSVFYVSLPALTCYCTEINGSSFDESGMMAYLAHEKCVEAGYRLFGGEPLMTIYDDPRACVDQLGAGSKFTMCVPVIPESKDDPNLRFFPATEALAILGFGYYTVIARLWEILFEEVERRGLEPSGHARLIGLTAPYSGAHYDPEDFCYECVIPIKERKE